MAISRQCSLGSVSASGTLGSGSRVTDGVGTLGSGMLCRVRMRCLDSVGTLFKMSLIRFNIAISSLPSTFLVCVKVAEISPSAFTTVSSGVIVG